MSITDNLPIAQADFRRIFFSGLVLASIAVMVRFARSFPVLYDGNPEVIIQQVIKKRGLQPLSDGTFSAIEDYQFFLEEFTDDFSEETTTVHLEHDTVQALKTDLNTPKMQNKGREMLLMYTTGGQKQRHVAQNEGKSLRCCSCVML